MSTANLTISHLSTEYVIIPLNATVNGQIHDPTGDLLQFAFLSNQSASPGNTDWVVGIWGTNSNSSLYPFLAECLVGPAGGVINLGTGVYVIWIKITDNPEIPVLQAGMLTVV